MLAHAPLGHAVAGHCKVADRDAFLAHLAAIADEQWVPGWQRLALVQAAVGASLGQPSVFRHRIWSQFVAAGDFLQTVAVILAAGRVDIQELAGDAVHGNHIVIDIALQAALPAAVAQGFPLF